VRAELSQKQMKRSSGHLKEGYSKGFMALHVKMMSGELNTMTNNTVYKNLDIVRVIKLARIRWLGLLVRMEENSPCKKITFSQLEGSRRNGRLKLRWLGSVLKCVKLLKVDTWWKKTLDRNICGRNIKESMVHK
jgi:hypothetical protein